MRNSFRFVRTIFFSFILILFTIVMTLTENTKKPPEHHLENGTFVNTNGVANNKKLKELWKWLTGKKETKAIPIDFEMVDPNLELINQENLKILGRPPYCLYFCQFWAGCPLTFFQTRFLPATA